MNDNSAEILKELKKITTEMEYQKKIKRRTWIGSIIFGLLLVLLYGFAISKIKTELNSFDEPTKQTKWEWYHVRNDIENGALDDALEKAQYLVKKSPNYEDGYTQLGNLFVVRNELDKAKDAFKKAYDIFPSEYNEKKLNTIIKKIEKEKSS